MGKDLDEIMDGFSTGVSLSYARSTFPEGADPLEDPPSEVVLCLQFSEKGFGFGEVTLKQTPEGVFLDTEHMSLKRVKRYFEMLLDSAITDTEQDPEKHALYNKVTGTRCGEQCILCHPKPGHCKQCGRKMELEEGDQQKCDQPGICVEYQPDD